MNMNLAPAEMQRASEWSRIRETNAELFRQDVKHVQMTHNLSG